ncbi:hypothetical protein BJ912DRAFT_1126484 [Pholiota molesta]|nr:hypothetical protein BJ912DRAFT_1126484 [Pholiota molesta]
MPPSQDPHRAPSHPRSSSDSQPPRSINTASITPNSACTYILNHSAPPLRSPDAQNTTAARTTAPPSHPLYHPPPPRHPPTHHPPPAVIRAAPSSSRHPSTHPGPPRVSAYIQVLPRLGDDIRREMAARTSERDRRQGGLRAAECDVDGGRGVDRLRCVMGSARGWRWTARGEELQDPKGTDGWAAVLDGVEEAACGYGGALALARWVVVLRPGGHR